MNLQALAAADLAFTLEGDGQVITLTSPSGISAELPALSNDIGLLIDPETGVPVSGRNASASLVIASITAAGLTLPSGEADGEIAPWLVSYTAVTGDVINTKVMSTMPDRALGVITCRLELVL